MIFNSDIHTKREPEQGGGGLTEIDAEFKIAKIQNSYVEGGEGLGEIDAEFKFAKIQNSYVWWDGGGGGGDGTFDAESKFAIKKKFAKNFLSFRTKI